MARALLAKTGSREIPTTRRPITRGGRPGAKAAPGIAATTVGKRGLLYTRIRGAWLADVAAGAAGEHNIHGRKKGGGKPSFFLRDDTTFDQRHF